MALADDFGRCDERLAVRRMIAGHTPDECTGHALAGSIAAGMVYAAARVRSVRLATGVIKLGMIKSGTIEAGTDRARSMTGHRCCSSLGRVAPGAAGDRRDIPGRMAF